MKADRQQEDLILNPKAARCPDSWWADPRVTREEWMARQATRVAAMKQTRQAGYGRADGVDAQ